MMAPNIVTVIILLSFPKMIGIGPMSITPPVLTLVSSPSRLLFFPEDNMAVPKNVSSTPTIKLLFQ